MKEAGVMDWRRGGVAEPALTLFEMRFIFHRGVTRTPLWFLAARRKGFGGDADDVRVWFALR